MEPTATQPHASPLTPPSPRHDVAVDDTVARVNEVVTALKTRGIEAVLLLDEAGAQAQTVEVLLGTSKQIAGRFHPTNWRVEERRMASDAPVYVAAVRP